MEGILPHGKTDPAIVREIFVSQKGRHGVLDSIEDILEAYVSFLPEEVERSETYQVLPGIADFLSQYGRRPDVACGLATGNIERGARIKLERGNLNPYFKFGGFGSDSENRATLVRRAAQKAIEECQILASPNDTFVIGDTPLDIEAGREAGFRTIGVATSTYSTAMLEAAGADLVMNDFERDRDQFLRLTRIL